MGKKTPKQYLSLGDRPVLAQTLKAFDSCHKIDRILLVVSRGNLDFCRETVLSPFHFKKQIKLVSGGGTRQESVYNGIRALEEKTAIVVIHDGVRPFVLSEQIETCIAVASKFGACILGIPSRDTLKRVGANGIIETTVQRNAIWHSQTPQVFRYELIRRAHENAVQDGFVGSDDAQLVERLGGEIRIVCGNSHNFKITTPEDLLIARKIID